MENISNASAIIPEGLRIFEMRDKKRKFCYNLVFSKESLNYERWIEHLKGPDNNINILLDLFQRKGTLVDVGANIGTIAIPVAVQGTQVVAIEMHPANCLKLSSAVLANGLSNVRLIQAAASDYDGKIAYQGDEAWGHVLPNFLGNSGNIAQCMRIDTILGKLGEHLPEPLILKIDVEGHEAAVIRGARDTLKSRQPLILFESIETEGRPSDSQKEPKVILESLGYKLYLIRGDILVPRTSRDLQEGHVCDFLAVPEKGISNAALPDNATRPLTEEESLTWVDEMVSFPQKHHQRHAAGVFLRWGYEKPDLCMRGQPILLKLLKLDHISDLHGPLSQLLAP